MDLSPIHRRKVYAALKRLGFEYDTRSCHEIWRHRDGRRISLASDKKICRENHLTAILREGRISREDFFKNL